ncbi:MAG TPA: TonB-dependent receptor, partial [Bryobacteraceae bacterium]|nr:TonB-dependent receptor [Bryobacteraceae bacterium]
MNRNLSFVVVFVLTVCVTTTSAQTPPPPSSPPGNSAATGPVKVTGNPGSPGAIVGTVFDASTGQPVRNAKVSVAGRPETATTDTDGKFRLEISAGRYKVTYIADNYSEASVDAVEVIAGDVVEASTVMANRGSVTTVDVVERVGAVAATAEAALTERKLAGTVSDSISSEEMRGGVSSDAAGALEKVTGVSIVENGYVYVRGLGERYSATMLNNALIPTTEPEKRVVPLDLFPASMMESIRVLKTYSPDLPGEFSGGLVQMNTVDFPTTRTFRAGFSLGYNTRTTLDSVPSYPGGDSDFWGFDDGSRQLPRLIPRDRRLFQGQFTEAEFQEFGRALSNNWERRMNDSMRPNQSYSMVGGGTFGRFGIIGALTASNKPQRYDELQTYYRNGGTIENPQQTIYSNYPNFNSNVESARLGGVLNLAIRLTPSNKIVFRNALTRDSDKETRFFEGLSGSLGDVIQDERLRWVERSLLSSSVEGEHGLALLKNALLRWQFTYSTATRDEPDLRELVRGDAGDGRFIFLTQQNSGLRFFNDLDDRIYEPQVEISHPFYKGFIS